MKITFATKLKEKVLDQFGKAVGNENYIVEKKTGNRILSSEGEDVHLKEFSGIKRGSEIYLKSDIISLIKFVENRS